MLVCFHVSHPHSCFSLKASWWTLNDITSLIPLTHWSYSIYEWIRAESRGGENRRVDEGDSLTWLLPYWPLVCCHAHSKPSGPIHLTACSGKGAAWIIDGLNLTRHRWHGDGIQQLLGFASTICCHKNICRQGHPVTLC